MICGSFSKSHAMTGWRVGFGMGPKEWIQAMLKIQSHSTSNANSITQMAAVEAANGPQESIGDMIAEYQRRRDWLVPALNEIPGIKCDNPEGAFYAFPNMKGLIGKHVKNSSELATYLLEKKGVALTAGAAFGGEGYVRISYANSLQNIQEGVRRIREAAKELA
jgi:aspartate aminotransferase